MTRHVVVNLASCRFRSVDSCQSWSAVVVRNHDRLRWADVRACGLRQDTYLNALPHTSGEMAP